MAPVSKVVNDVKINEVNIIDPTRPASVRYVELRSDSPISLSGFSLLIMAESHIEVRGIFFNTHDDVLVLETYL